MYFYILFMFFGGVFVFCSARKHLLVTLFSLEYLVLVLFLMFMLFLMKFGFEFYFLLIYLVFSVCEGALGLGILVSMIRSHGNDYLSSMSVLSW
uniref:NADH-ubiquinone oxidoreductase chain 4L n=1 Tax=Neolethaeus assamensis TaxID=1589711 RepID=A0A343ISH4_9HEMI|nr:NADH dehydrogenase subunit 4L [Neolethaeus assamensis]AST10199.1 NADH dehydrogenase subunit 4L [Neolethaeus assamensis]